MSGPVHGRCHCGTVRWTVPHWPDTVTACNCSVCRRLGTLWAYYDASEVKLAHDEDAVIAYRYGDENIEFVSCKTCGGTTHWRGKAAGGRIAVNMRMAEPDLSDQLTIRHFDGADSWTYLDQT